MTKCIKNDEIRMRIRKFHGHRALFKAVLEVVVPGEVPRELRLLRVAEAGAPVHHALPAAHGPVRHGALVSVEQPASGPPSGHLGISRHVVVYE